MTAKNRMNADAPGLRRVGPNSGMGAQIRRQLSGAVDQPTTPPKATGQRRRRSKRSHPDATRRDAAMAQSDRYIDQHVAEAKMTPEQCREGYLRRIRARSAKQHREICANPLTWAGRHTRRGVEVLFE